MAEDGGWPGWSDDHIHMGIAVGYKRSDRWDPEKYPSFVQWVCWGITNLAREDLRKRTRRKKLDPAALDEAIEKLMVREPIDGFETCILQDSLKGVVQRLNPVMQATVALYYCAGLTDKEISQVLKMSLATVQSNRQRALERAREYYRLLHPKTLDSPAAAPASARQRKARDSTESPGDGDKPPPQEAVVNTDPEHSSRENGEG
jgi:RNA polymerase sigma factor (sigma-70 family)